MEQTIYKTGEMVEFYSQRDKGTHRGTIVKSTDHVGDVPRYFIETNSGSYYPNVTAKDIKRTVDTILD